MRWQRQKLKAEGKLHLEKVWQFPDEQLCLRGLCVRRRMDGSYLAAVGGRAGVVVLGQVPET